MSPSTRSTIEHYLTLAGIVAAIAMSWAFLTAAVQRLETEKVNVLDFRTHVEQVNSQDARSAVVDSLLLERTMDILCKVEPTHRDC